MNFDKIGKYNKWDSFRDKLYCIIGRVALAVDSIPWFKGTVPEDHSRNHSIKVTCQWVRWELVKYIYITSLVLYKKRINLSLGQLMQVSCAISHMYIYHIWLADKHMLYRKTLIWTNFIIMTIFLYISVRAQI